MASRTLANFIHREFKRLALADALEWLSQVSQEDAETMWRVLEERGSGHALEGLSAEQLQVLKTLAMVGYNEALLRLRKSRDRGAGMDTSGNALSTEPSPAMRAGSRRSRSTLKLSGPA